MRMFRMTASDFGRFSMSAFICFFSTLALAASILLAWQHPASAEILTAQNQSQLVRKPATPSKSDSEFGTMYPTTPTVGSPEWQKEQRESERKDQRLKAIMEGICKGC